MSVLTAAQTRLLDENDHGVIATLGRDGYPRQSVVYYARDGDRLLISTLANRAKTRDVRTTNWASLSVSGAERPHPSATFSGPAKILTEGIGPATALVMQRITGADEPPEPTTDEALAEAGRVLLVIEIDRVAAVTHLEHLSSE
jgi:PPOX class probable F420-dependent enzyme